MKKQFVIIGIIALLVCVGLSGCTQQTSSNNQSSNNNSQPSSPEVKTITISDVNSNQTINYTEHPIYSLYLGWAVLSLYQKRRI